MKKNNIKIGFLDSFVADTSTVTKVVDVLIKDLKGAGYPQSEIDEIVLSMDESITNAVQETLKKCVSDSYDKNRRDITIRYAIEDDVFDATIIDNGTGLDLFDVLKSVPDSNSDGYYDNVSKYAKNSDEERLVVTLNGKKIHLKGVGAGLKIILKFMDSVTINLIDKEKNLSTQVTNATDGTIFNMKRKRRYI